jgi:hypothetical protein
MASRPTPPDMVQVMRDLMQRRVMKPPNRATPGLIGGLVILAIGYVVAPNVTEAKPAFEIASWTGNVLAGDAAGTSRGCSVSTANNLGIELSVIKLIDGTEAIRFDSENWMLPVDEYLAVSLFVDYQRIESFYVKSESRLSFTVTPTDNAFFRSRVRRGILLTLGLAPESFNFNIQDIGKALERLDACVADQKQRPETKLAGSGELRPMAGAAHEAMTVLAPIPRIKPPSGVPAETKEASVATVARQSTPQPEAEEQAEFPFGRGNRWSLGETKDDWSRSIIQLLALAGRGHATVISESVVYDTAYIKAKLGVVAEDVIGFVHEVEPKEGGGAFSIDEVTPLHWRNCEVALPRKDWYSKDGVEVLEYGKRCRNAAGATDVEAVFFRLARPDGQTLLLAFWNGAGGPGALEGMRDLRSLVVEGRRSKRPVASGQ